MTPPQAKAISLPALDAEGQQQRSLLSFSCLEGAGGGGESAMEGCNQLMWFRETRTKR